MPGLNSFERARLLAGVSRHLSAEGIELAICLRSRLFDRGALLANAFVPIPLEDHFVSIFRRTEIPLTAPKTWHLLTR